MIADFSALALASYAVWTSGAVRSGMIIHEKLLDSVLSATLRFVSSSLPAHGLRASTSSLMHHCFTDGSTARLKVSLEAPDLKRG